MNVGEKIVVDGVGWTLENASADGVEFVANRRANGVVVFVDPSGVSCSDAYDKARVAPIEVVEAAIQIWKELNS